ncbi:organic hydroperoxide resistance protein, partial [Streptomyces xinghaiensis]
MAKSGHRTPRTALTCALSLAHGLPIGWGVLPITHFPFLLVSSAY